MSKEGIQLDYPIAIGDEKRAEYARNGILLKKRGPSGYTRLETPFDLTVADFASLSTENLYKLSSHLQNTKYDKTVDQAERIQELVLQAKTVPQDGFPLPTEVRPFAWQLREKLPIEIDLQLDKLKKLGIKDVKVGLEMEFSCNEKAIPGFYHWRTVKKGILRDLRGQLLEIEKPEDKLAIESKIEEVRQFGAREILMYDFIELDPETKDFLEPLFGKTRDGNGYYDGQGVLELKFKPTDPNSSLNNRMIVLKKLFDKATRYGLEISHAPSFHINISLWDKNGNIFDNKNPSFKKKAKVVVEGVTRAFYDSIFTLIDKHYAQSDRLKSLALDVHRENLLRYSSDRIEIRPSVSEAAQDPSAMIAVFLSGAIYGLESKNPKEKIHAIKVSSPLVHHTKDTSKVTSHVLNNSVIKKGGTLFVSKEYIKEHEETLEYELGLEDKPPMGSHPILKMFYTSENEEHIQKFFALTKLIKSQDGELSFKFPETEDGKYVFYLPPVNMDKIPKSLQDRVIKGEKIAHEEWGEYLLPGERIPRPGKYMTIDVARLSRTVSVHGITSKFVVNKYDINKTWSTNNPKNWSREGWARLRRLQYSKPLAHGMEEEFKKEFKKIAKKFAAPERYKTPKPPEFTEVRKMFFHKIKDHDYVFETKRQYMVDSWLKHGNIEGIDFYKNSIKIEFENVYGGEEFAKGIKRIMSIINKGRVKKHTYIIDYKKHGNGTSDVVFEVTPKVFKVLKRLIK